ncbi:uncharacterized protein DMAD_00292 [Drosophila madeirensis]|uniref:Uncharacterized protein n=1 Tax=Drosophila madeirensis TaxID=30013 RepID=A0AAU9FXH8_DROMD
MDSPKKKRLCKGLDGLASTAGPAPINVPASTDGPAPTNVPAPSNVAASTAGPAPTNVPAPNSPLAATEAPVHPAVLRINEFAYADYDRPNNELLLDVILEVHSIELYESADEEDQNADESENEDENDSENEDENDSENEDQGEDEDYSWAHEVNLLFVLEEYILNILANIFQ